MKGLGMSHGNNGSGRGLRQQVASQTAKTSRQQTSGSLLDSHVGAGLAFVVISASVAFLLMALLGPRTETAVVASVAAPTVTADVAPLDTIRQRMTTGEDGRTFEFALQTPVSAYCFERINAVRPWRHPGWTNRALDETNGILKFEYEVAGEALNCLLTESQARFCQPGERAKVAKAVASYVAMYRRDQARAQRTGSRPATPREKMYEDLANRMSAMDEPGHENEALDDTTQFFVGIENVTAAGYFTAADFGGKANPELATHILPALSKPCR